jgi:glucose-6-phosphate 1-dehydrogenase
MLGKLFKEEQIFRIDHYLAKESLQNILMFRFSNALFEPVWSKDHIDKVEIRFHEAIGIEGRGEFYEDIGALRDVGQNHMLQMLAIIAMERPDELGAKAIRSRRARVLASLDPIIEKDVIDLTIRGQFKGYKDEADVAVDSQTETYFRLTANINNDRWDGVPFVLESGKQMKNTVNEMVITFKEKGMCLCPPEQHSSHANKLSFRIQPDEGISILFWAKKPGFEFGLEQKDLSFKYTDSPDSQALPDAYERVLYDCIRGDQTLFASTEEIAASWTFISPILEGWKNAELIVYDKGTDGPQK